MRLVIAQTIAIVFSLIEVAILIRVFLSWLPVSRENRLVYLLYQITEPILAPVRSMIDRLFLGRNMMFDFSPIVAYILLRLLRTIILNLLV